MSMTIKLYNYTGDAIVVNKTGWLTNATLLASLDGVLKDNTSVTDPSIIIEYGSMPAANYAYIADLGRYYFINQITALSATLWRLDMHVDVLMSYKGVKNGSSSTGIYGLSAFVDRYVGSDSDYLIENAYPIKGNATITRTTGTTASSWKGSTGFMSSTPTDYHYLMLFNGYTVYNNTMYPPSLGIAHVAMTYDRMVEVMKAINESYNSAGNPVAAYIASLNYIPMPMTMDLNNGVDTISFRGIMNDILTPTGAINTNSRILTSTWSISVTPPSTTNKWKNFQPYTSIVLTFLPFGRFSLDNSLVFASGSSAASLTVTVKFDILTGDAVLYYRTGTGADIYLGSANVVIPCPLMSTSVNMMKLIGGMVNIGAGIVSLGTGNIAGGMAGMASGMASTGSTLDSASLTQSAGGFKFINENPTVDVIFHDIEGTAATLVGKPYCATAMLGTLSGFAKVGRVHVNSLPGCPTSTEIDEVETLLLAGVEL